MVMDYSDLEARIMAMDVASNAHITKSMIGMGRIHQKDRLERLLDLYGTPQFGKEYQQASHAEGLSHHGIKIMRAVEALWMPDIIKLQGQIAAAEREEANRRRMDLFMEKSQRLNGEKFNKVFWDEIPNGNWHEQADLIAKLFEASKQATTKPQQQQLPEPKPPAKKGFPWFFGKRRW
ncbi:hypothetical protein ADP65_00035 [Achromobacter phage phiAxp-3]|uniref:Uncharacterized protein n=1 Tax=Achromobacter phage phiAxp-3 TaxID=1664247 RepID=A0A0K2FI11_9CAUD|nr:hypothetical protein ADP65_00035 [Achromobacter phage phiAxp-3]ALA45504.1 hypothetical protein ADP65_00035 [Achromobacter phage phiAxp-3]